MFHIPFIDETVHKLFNKSYYDDTIGRICSTLTPRILIFFTLFVSAKQYIGDPIKCWVPQEFEDSWEEYAEDICFVKNTYYIPKNESIPKDQFRRNQAEIGYYQWVPIILLLMAFMFYLPKLIRNLLIKQTGIDLDTIIIEAIALKNYNEKDRGEILKRLKNYLNECLELNNQDNSFCLGYSTSEDNRLLCLTTINLFANFLHTINIMIQFSFVNKFLGPKYTMWGYEVVKNLVYGNEWEDSPIFPRVTLCDFQVRRLANIHHYTVQCVLMINMINEKIFLFIWFWFLFVIVISIINFLYSIWKFSIPINREKNLNSYFKDYIGKRDGSIYFKKIFSKFINKYIKADGYFILNYIERQVGGVLFKEIVRELFNDFFQKEVK